MAFSGAISRALNKVQVEKTSLNRNFVETYQIGKFASYNSITGAGSGTPTVPATITDETTYNVFSEVNRVTNPTDTQPDSEGASGFFVTEEEEEVEEEAIFMSENPMGKDYVYLENLQKGEDARIDAINQLDNPAQITGYDLLKNDGVNENVTLEVDIAEAQETATEALTVQSKVELSEEVQNLVKTIDAVEYELTDGSDQIFSNLAGETNQAVQKEVPDYRSAVDNLSGSDNLNTSDATRGFASETLDGLKKAFPNYESARNATVGSNLNLNDLNLFP